MYKMDGVACLHDTVHVVRNHHGRHLIFIGDFFDQLINDTELVVIGHNTDYGRDCARLAERFMPVIDLVGLGNSFKYAKNCQGICW